MRIRPTSPAIQVLRAGIAVALGLVCPNATAQGPAAPSFGGSQVVEETIDGQMVIDVRDDATAADVADIEARYGVRMHPNSKWSADHDKLEVAAVDPAREQRLIEALSADRRVEHAEPMAIYRATFVPDDPLYTTKQWHLRRVGAERAWNYSCGTGVTVAVVDTGVACFDKGPFSRGTDLAGTRCEHGWNFVDDSPDAYDDQGHGTHVAGTIAQTTNNGMGAAGLAFCATLMPIRVLNKQGFGTVANVAEGIRYAADEGAQVINLSLGGPIKSRILGDAVKHALEAGAVIVAAAGNSGRGVGWPAAYPGVIAVSATDASDEIAWFSSRGPEIAIAAPGVSVTQQTVCNGGHDKCEVFGTFNGTSMASPHVAGAAAMIESLGVTDGASVREVLGASARRPNAGHDGNLFGAGILDVSAAASRTFWRHFALRALALAVLVLALATRVRKRGRRIVPTAGAIFGALAAGLGLLPFLPLLGLSARAGAARTLVELIERPFGQWDLVLFGADTHKWLLLSSALPAFALAALGFSSRRIRPIIGGVALGTAALLAQTAWSGDEAFVGGALLLRVWALAHGLICVWLARMALDEKRA
jgi:serine protease